MARSTAPTLLAALLLLALAFAGTQALGINCQGSLLCTNRGDAMVQIRDSINRDIDPTRQYGDGDQIACTQSQICAFVQNSGTTTAGSEFGRLVGDLVDHRCGTCGSVPLDFPNSNDVDAGELTVNFVTSPCFRLAGSLVCV